MKKLFLLKADFQDASRADGKRYFCPPCTMVEGILSYYPRLRNELEVVYVDFLRPRPEIIELIGEENQSCPVLVFEDGSFLDNENEIISHLSENHQIGISH